MRENVEERLGGSGGRRDRSFLLRHSCVDTTSGCVTESSSRPRSLSGEPPGGRHFNQVPQRDIPRDVMQTSGAPIRCDRGETHLVVVLSQTHNPSLTMRKTSDEPGMETFSRTPSHSPSRLPGSEKPRKPRRHQRHHAMWSQDGILRQKDINRGIGIE